MRHSFFVTIWPGFLGFCVTSMHTILPGPLAYDQKATPSTCLILLGSFRPWGITSPWQNQADFWCGWSVEDSPNLSMGQARVIGMPPGAMSGQKIGLA